MLKRKLTYTNGDIQSAVTVEISKELMEDVFQTIPGGHFTAGRISSIMISHSMEGRGLIFIPIRITSPNSQNINYYDRMVSAPIAKNPIEWTQMVEGESIIFNTNSLTESFAKNRIESFANTIVKKYFQHLE